jgi:hypothetical protein
MYVWEEKEVRLCVCLCGGHVMRLSPLEHFEAFCGNFIGNSY